MDAAQRLPLIRAALQSSALRGKGWQQLFADSVIGVLIGLIALVYAESYAAVVFSGDLSVYVPFGVTSALIGTALVGVSVALKGSMRLAVVSLSANNVAILPLVVTPVARAARDSGADADVLATVMFLLGLSTALTGAFLLVLGRLGLGRLVRLVPHAVVGGYTAGTGWLIMTGAIKIATGRPVSLDQLPSMLQASELARWLPGLGLALIFLLVLSRFKHVTAVPAVLFGALFLFYIYILATGMSLDTARSRGWLLSANSGTGWYAPLQPVALSHIDWPALSGAIGSLAAFPVIAAMALLLSTTGSEIVTRQDADLDHELAVAGLANVASGALGGFFGMQTQSLTTLAYNSRGRSRVVGMATALVSACAVVVSGSLVAYIPTPLLGGLLFYAGITMVREWLYVGWFRLSHLDYLIVVLILVVMVTVGLLQAVVAGLVIACFVFAFNYGRIGVVKFELSGADHRSNVVRSLQQERLLAREGHEFTLLILQGYIFFGTANSLYQHVRQLMDTHQHSGARCVLLDFGLVTGLDASALRSFLKMRQAAEGHQVQLVLTNCRPAIATQLWQSKVLMDGDSVCKAFEDLDRGVEWWETQVLNASSLRRQRYVPLTFHLEDIFPLPEKVPEFMDYLEPLSPPADTTLFAAGDPLDAVYFVEAGQVTVSTGSGQTARRVQTLGAGTVVGELELYQNGTHARSARTDRETQVYRLSRGSLENMQANDPELVAAFHQLMASLLAQRLARVDREIDLLLR